MKLSPATFARDLEPAGHAERSHAQLGDQLDPETREKLEQLRRGEQVHS